MKSTRRSVSLLTPSTLSMATTRRSKPAGGDPSRAVPRDGEDEEDPFKDLGLEPADGHPSGSGPARPEPELDDVAGYEPSEPGEAGPAPEAPPVSDAPQSVPPGGEALEPRRISPPLPGQEVSKGPLLLISA